ncbi:phosphoribosylanthranilate isomerase [Virgibacillus halophilus]|uniref:N-(5'-phosphoribosyl)anthranilate isomerase n=1 Tax=Tigheibacillus halophilus TaxID=361280 RepID=A0ABU5C9C9_9BACI|nr:phosphoribosylanthranilate isomerase [Virgibacillus halophilus]
MFVKICGIQTLEAAQTAIQQGADLLGFIFADSKRYIAPEKARVIIDTIPEHVKSVGVFVNESISHMESMAALAGLDYIQLHGNESPDVAAQLSFPVIKAFSADADKLAEIKQYPCDYILLDHPSGGGTGEAFDWRQFKTFHQELPPLLSCWGD